MSVKRRTPYGPKEGVTLTETLVAIAILAIGITGISRLILSTKRLSDSAYELNTEVQLAKNRLEQMSLEKFEHLSSWASSDLITDAAGTPSTDGRYKISTDVAYQATNAETNLAEVVIQVTRRNRKTLNFDLQPQLFTSYISSELSN